MTTSFSSIIADIFCQHQDNTRMLIKYLIRNVRVLENEYGKDAITKELATYYPFYENDSNKLLRSYLCNKYEICHKGSTFQALEQLFENNGILVFQICEDWVKVVHPNNKQNNATHPIQVSKWALEIGVTGDAYYASLESALKEESLICEKPIIDENILSRLEEILVIAECDFQERFKSHTGAYRLQ
jgi:hypothetical protein